MKELEQKIISEGKLLEGNILKVGSFLNQQVDTKLLKLMAKEVKRLFEKENITKVLTIESSGIPFAAAIALELEVPFVFAKKGMASNLSGDLVSAQVYSYTNKKVNEIFASREYIKESDSILIADDFLANGEALRGLISLVEQCNAKVVGCVVEIEKEFQQGGNTLRSEGYKVEALASIKQIDANTIYFN